MLRLRTTTKGFVSSSITYKIIHLRGGVVERVVKKFVTMCCLVCVMGEGEVGVCINERLLL